MLPDPSRYGYHGPVRLVEYTEQEKRALPAAERHMFDNSELLQLVSIGLDAQPTHSHAPLSLVVWNTRTLMTSPYRDGVLGSELALAVMYTQRPDLSRDQLEPFADEYACGHDAVNGPKNGAILRSYLQACHDSADPGTELRRRFADRVRLLDRLLDRMPSHEPER